jgi:uncharacterized DUF497 family protein
MPQFIWNEQKSRSNRLKHGISFETAALIWSDPNYLLVPDAVYDGEERWLAIGRNGITTVLVAVHTSYDDDGEETIRIISARKATAHERKQYEKSIAH